MNAITKVAMVALLVLTCTLFGVQWQRIDDLERQVNGLERQLKDPYAATAQPKLVEHKYRFERNGASLSRYDETSGEACQLESNVTDNWMADIAHHDNGD